MQAVSGRQADGRAHVVVNLTGFRRWAKKLVEAITVAERTEITVQTDQVFILRKRRFRRAWCEQCACDVDAVDLREALKFAGTMQPTLPSNGPSQEAHVCTGDDGKTLICLRSLLKSLQSENSNPDYQGEEK